MRIKENSKGYRNSLYKRWHLPPKLRQSVRPRSVLAHVPGWWDLLEICPRRCPGRASELSLTPEALGSRWVGCWEGCFGSESSAVCVHCFSEGGQQRLPSRRPGLGLCHPAHLTGLPEGEHALDPRQGAGSRGLTRSAHPCCLGLLGTPLMLEETAGESIRVEVGVANTREAIQI